MPVRSFRPRCRIPTNVAVRRVNVAPSGRNASSAGLLWSGQPGRVGRSAYAISGFFHPAWTLRLADYCSKPLQCSGLGTRNHTQGFTGGHGQSETSDAFIDTEDFRESGDQRSLSLTTVWDGKSTSCDVLMQGETRKRQTYLFVARRKFTSWRNRRVWTAFLSAGK